MGKIHYYLIKTIFLLGEGVNYLTHVQNYFDMTVNNRYF